MQRLSMWLGLAFLCSEVALSLSRRSSGGGVRQDRSTLRTIWIVISLSVVAAVAVASRYSQTAIPRSTPIAMAGVLLFLCGILLRWRAIVVLGRFFTVDVQIAPDHQLVERGPFRLIRHPSYTGILLAFVGYGLCLFNWAALAVLLVPIWLVFARRIRVEEEALRNGLGETYVAYTDRTKRLLPFIY